jgi:hypothetical protein
MSTLLNFGRDVQGMNAYAPQFPKDVFTATLAAGTGSSITVPVSAPTWIMYVRVEPAGWVWCSRNGTAAVPAAGTFGAAVSELIAGTIEYKRTVYAGDVIHFITANTTCDIEVALFQVSYP